MQSTTETKTIKLEEIMYNLSWSYKKPWNRHFSGLDCWCKPVQGKLYLMHRNYEWRDNSWHAIRQPETSNLNSLPNPQA